MRIKLTLIKPDGNIRLPVHYNHIVQAFIYRYMGKVAPELTELLHSEGFKVQKGRGVKRFKFFTFSRIIPSGDVRREGGYLVFPRTVFLVVCSPLSRILEAFARGVVKPDRVTIGEERLIVKEVSVETLKEPLNGPIHIRTLSPITVRDTLREGGRRYSLFLSPFSKDFSDRLKENLRDKWLALTGEELTSSDFRLQLVDGATYRKRVVRYKEQIVEAWDGEFLLDGSSELLQMALYSGLGERNSQGFGCVEPVRKRH